MNPKIEQIRDSFINGQHAQGRQQVRKYGIKRFIKDVLNDLHHDKQLQLYLLRKFYGAE